MKDEVEKISNPYSVSFICSFGYKIAGKIGRPNRLDDMYIFKAEEGGQVIVARRDFFDHVSTTFGGVVLSKRKPKLNPLISYDMFFNIQI